jgi:hypothetical protein
MLGPPSLIKISKTARANDMFIIYTPRNPSLLLDDQIKESEIAVGVACRGQKMNALNFGG